jgi:hypothetical protein
MKVNESARAGVTDKPVRARSRQSPRIRGRSREHFFISGSDEWGGKTFRKLRVKEIVSAGKIFDKQEPPRSW